MKKRVLILNLICLSIHSIFAQSDKSIVVLDMLPVVGETLMLDLNGNVISTFASNERCKIEDDIRLKHTVLSLERSFVLYDFTQGYLPVVNGKNWKFYNMEGNEVKDYGEQFFSFSCPVDGVYRAFELIPNRSNAYMIVYINQDFKEMFNGQRFWEGSNLGGGYGFVQLENEEGPWAILDSQKEIITPIDSMLSKRIKNIKKEDNGYGKISYKDSNIRNYITRSGEIFDSPPVNEKIELNKEQKKVVENIKNCINNHTLAISSGIGIDKPDYMPKYKSENTELNRGVVNRNFIPKWMKLTKNEFFVCTMASGDLFGGLVIDTSSRENKYMYYNYAEKKKIFTAKNEIKYVFEDRFFITTPSASGYGTNLIEILDQNGNSLYSLSPANRLFVGIKSAEEFNKDEIFNLKLDKDEDLSNLHIFNELRHIEFDEFSFEQLPSDLLALEKLESLKIINCKNLRELPLELNHFKNLRNLEIENCQELKNLETIIEECNGLEYVKTVNYRYEQGFGKKIEELKPDLKLRIEYHRQVDLEEYEKSRFKN